MGVAGVALVMFIAARLNALSFAFRLLGFIDTFVWLYFPLLALVNPRFCRAIAMAYYLAR